MRHRSPPDGLLCSVSSASSLSTLLAATHKVKGQSRDGMKLRQPCGVFYRLVAFQHLPLLIRLDLVHLLEAYPLRSVHPDFAYPRRFFSSSHVDDELLDPHWLAERHLGDHLGI